MSEGGVLNCVTAPRHPLSLYDATRAFVLYILFVPIHLVLLPHYFRSVVVIPGIGVDNRGGKRLPSGRTM